ncbi:MAG: ATP-dependent helicase RecQ, partial [Pseudonocardiales bacterium]|nr:ATP-dependent helicase RecQ [Pseudonocardiales bacterium]
AANDALARPGVVIEPRRQWPSAMAGLGVELKGKVAAGELAEAGRAVARFTDLGYGQRVRAVLATNGAVPVSDGPVPDDLLAAAVQVLANWDWPQRPVAVVHIGSSRHPRLVEDFARRIGSIGRLPHLGQVTRISSAQDGPATDGRSNSAQRLRIVLRRHELVAGLAGALTGEHRGAPLLLIDDYTDSGWTLTVTSRLLRRAGAGAVYPFVLGLAG